MAQKSRELSQFSSFLEVDNSNQNIGITIGSTPYIGIGTTNPTKKLHVIGDVLTEGDTSVVGYVSATSYYLNGNPLVSADVVTWSISGSDIYKENGNVGIGTSTISERLTVLGNVSAGQYISTVTSGTPPLIVASDTQVANLNASFLRGKLPPTGTIVGDSDNQTLTNKTIALGNNSVSGTISQFNAALTDADFVTISGSETLTNKTLTNPVISAISNSGIQTVPTGNGTLVSTNSVGVVTSGMIADGTITNSDIASGASIAISKLSASTISGVSLGSTLNNLTAGSFITYNSGTTYNGSAPITVSVAATSTNTTNTVVSRDASGDFNAGTIKCSNLNATFTVTAADINSTSDKNLKENIKTVENSLEIIQSLRGVSFDWKHTGKSSYGVIAQELEKILPELVNTGDQKSVNYNGLIGVLIEAVKELSNEVNDLKNFININSKSLVENHEDGN